MLPAVAEFFKTTVDASLAKLVQPSAIVPATVFILLNALFIHPSLVAAGFGPAVGLEALPDGLKIAVLIVLILILGYVVLSLNSTFLRLATGELWRGTPLYNWMLGRAVGRRRALEVARDLAQTNSDLAEDRWLAYEIARWPNEQQLTPTRLGNALGSSATAIYQRYGIDMNACWPPLQSLVAKEASALSSLIDDARGSLDLLLNLALSFALFGIEGLVVQTVNGSFQGAAYALVAIPVAYGCYRAAAARAVGWGDLIETAFDLHRDLLATELGLRKAADFADAKKLWESASRFLLYPGTKTADLFDEPKESKAVSVSPSPNLAVAEVYAAEVVNHVPSRRTDRTVQVAVHRANLFTVTAKQRMGAGATAGQVRVVDAQSGVFAAAPLAAPVDAGIGKLTPEVIPGSEPRKRSELMWHVTLATPTNALALRYDLPLATIKLEVRQPTGWAIELEKNADPRATTFKAMLRGPGTSADEPAADEPAADEPAADEPAAPTIHVVLAVSWSRWEHGEPARLSLNGVGHLEPESEDGSERVWSMDLASPTLIKLFAVEEPA
ncbi:MAG: hypothetical protein ABJC24_00180 [Chloroflexota bacterium]